MNQLLSANNAADKIKEYALNLSLSDIEGALLVAKIYGTFLWLNNIGVLADMDFEKKMAHNVRVVSSSFQRNVCYDTLQLMTSALTTGGHTGVVLRLVNNNIGDGLAVLGELPELVKKNIHNNIKIYNQIQTQNGLETIAKIVEIGLKYKNIILHIDPNDIYSAISAYLLSESGVKVFMYNHADHVFSFGYAAANVVLEISKYGWNKGDVRGICDKQSFVGIPLDLREVSQSSKCEGKIFVSGSGNKFMPFGEFSFPILINRLVEKNIFKNNISINIIGPTGLEKYWNQLNAISLKKVKFIGRIPYDDYINELSTSCCYIDSFPIANGTAFAEAVMLGIPSFGLNIYSGYSCADQLRSTSVSVLLNSIEDFLHNINNYYYVLDDVRSQLIREQSVSVCADRINNIINYNTKISLLKSLSVAPCEKDFFEKYWTLNAEIYLPLRMLMGLKITQQIQIISYYFDCYRYLGKTTYSAIAKIPQIFGIK